MPHSGSIVSVAHLFYHIVKMKILEYTGLDTSSVKASYRKVTEALARDDFRSAQVKKLVNLTHGKFYRAKLDAANRLLFTLVRHGDEVCALMLEVITSHNYDKSRFLRGAEIDDMKIPDLDVFEAIKEAEPLRYLHPEHTAIHLLDKPISFDDAQESVYRQKHPLIIVGSAGSGKTALMLEKLKHAEGEVLYVTHSVYLAQNARNIYYGNGFEHSGQEAHFLSYREFVESLRVPAGREATWRDFSAWFFRMQNSFKGIDAHQAFEEIRGVITAGEGGNLSREEYGLLGVRQSIFPENQRDRLYDLFVKYLQWLDDEMLFDLNLVAHEWEAAPRYDFVVIDEVQDLTIAQLSLVLKTLKKPGHFLLCGDSNQIVHPNFFAWSQVKTLFWNDPKLVGQQQLSVLTANFRNGREATRISNQLLKIKHQRFGSIDRESNFLVQAVGGEPGQVVLMADKDEVKRDLDKKTKQSTRFAVLVMRDEDKLEARKHFATPLLFSIHEAKGLEYENIVLFRFVSGNRAEFNEIVDGVSREELSVETLEYRRAKDKGDKSLEVYKFFINAIYVALTRAIKNIYIIESDIGHRLFTLLDLASAGTVSVDAAESSLEEWQKEARKLELQGKQEQAEAIRRTILKEVPPPWPIFDESRLRELLVKVFHDKVPGNKAKQQLYEYATCHDEPVLAERLSKDAQFDARGTFADHLDTVGRKSYVPYFSLQTKNILKQCEHYGIDHRLPMNQTPLMAAAAAGNVPLTEALLERGADCGKSDQYGYNALHWAMRKAFRHPEYARRNFGTLYELLAPASVDVSTGDRMVRLDRHLSEYFLFQTLWVIFKSRFFRESRPHYGAVGTRLILDVWAHLPANVVAPERNKRQYLSSVLARNEVSRDYAYNRSLFQRITQGWYQFNPCLKVRSSDSDNKMGWIAVFQALNLPLIHEFACEDSLARLEQCFLGTGMRSPASVSGQQALARLEELEKMRERSREFNRLRRAQEEQRNREAIEVYRHALEQKKQLEREKQARKEGKKIAKLEKQEQLIRQQYTIEF
ncbi:MAG: AAA family ATPase [Chlorobium sp.]